VFTLYALTVVLVALLAHRAGGGPDVEPGALARALASRGLLGVVFVVTAAALWYRWGFVNPPAAVHDEMAYVLQSRIFALGRWSLPSPPVPSLWEQPHVLVQPALAGKYFPGHALVLTIGALLGWTALMPLVLAGIAAVLLVVLARRVSSPAVAVLAWVIWLTMPMVLYFGAAYYSESTTTVCWLAGWYALLRWRERGDTRWLVAVALCTGWCFVTRPLTGVAYAIPIAIVVLRDVWQGRHWRTLVVALAAGAAVLAIIPLWSARTTGSWRTTPLLLYTRQYMPYDVPGFTHDTTPPLLAVTPNLQHLNNAYGSLHVDHVPSRLPALFARRAWKLAESFWVTSRGLLMAFAILGLATLVPATAFAVASGIVLLALYLVFATPAGWTLYYYETAPTFAWLTAAGLAWAAAQLGRPRGALPAATFSWRSARWSLPLAAGAGLFLLPGLAELRLLRSLDLRHRAPLRKFEAVRAAIPPGPAILFVHYRLLHDNNISFVENLVDPAAERLWVVTDRGAAENARLMATAPERKTWIFDEEQDQIFRYDPALAP
jgi:hypothetical protein